MNIMGYLKSIIVKNLKAFQEKFLCITNLGPTRSRVRYVLLLVTLTLTCQLHKANMFIAYSVVTSRQQKCSLTIV